MRMISESIVEQFEKPRTRLLHTMQKILPANHLLNRHGGGATDRMRVVRLPVLESAGAFGNGVIDGDRADHSTDRLVSGTEAFPERSDVRHDAVLLACQESARSARPAHHLIQDQQYSIFVADFANPPKVARNGRHGSGSRSDDGLGDKSHDCIRTKALDLLLEIVGSPSAIFFRALPWLGEPIFEARIDQSHINQQGIVRRSAPNTAAGRQGAQCVSVIAELSSDQAASSGLSTLEMILPSKLHRRLGRFRTAAREPHPVESAGRHVGNDCPKFLGGFSREEPCVGIFEAVRLLGHRPDYRWMAVTKARNRGPSARVDVSPPIAIDQVNTLTLDRDWRSSSRRSMQDVIAPHPARLARGSGTS
jgi:hypothetical protein